MSYIYRVYLSGPIASLSPQEANTWREYAEKELIKLSDGKIVGINPIRNSSYIKQKQHTHMTDDSDVSVRMNDVLQTPKACMSRDFWDILHCDLILINCIGAPERISMGTCIEMGYGKALNKPIIVAVTEKDKYDTDLLFSACTDLKYRDLSIAIQRCCDYLLP